MLSFKPLSEVVLEDGSTQHKMVEIIEEAAKDPDLSGQSLLLTLVKSGVSLGVDQTAKHIHDVQHEIMKTLVEASGVIDKAILLIEDDESVKAVASVRDSLRRMVKERTDQIAEAFIFGASSALGIKESYLRGDVHPQDMGNIALGEVGFSVYRHSRRYFYEWFLNVKADRISSMSCRCPGCLHKAIPEGTQIKLDDLNSELIRLYEGIGPAMESFGEFVLLELRDTLSKILSNEPVHDHTEVSEDAGEMLRKMLGKFSGEDKADEE